MMRHSSVVADRECAALHPRSPRGSEVTKKAGMAPSEIGDNRCGDANWLSGLGLLPLFHGSVTPELSESDILSSTSIATLPLWRSHTQVLEELPAVDRPVTHCPRPARRPSGRLCSAPSLSN
ncbi:hypothetical protein J6590_038534 [Homalodisca vitripennis]|nr:hypothetical protein J6590_038534 [Homalodisca vitripennis]